MLTPINGRPCFFATYKENRAISSDTCVDYYILLLNYLSKTICNNERFQTLFKDQLDRSKATCSFKCLAQGHNCHDRDSNPYPDDFNDQNLSPML